MSDHRTPQLDMRLDGTFRTPPQPARPPLVSRIFFWAVLVAVAAAALSIAAFALWIALIILPVALGAAVIAWLAFRFQVWRARSRYRAGPPDFRRG